MNVADALYYGGCDLDLRRTGALPRYQVRQQDDAVYLSVRKRHGESHVLV